MRGSSEEVTGVSERHARVGREFGVCLKCKEKGARSWRVSTQIVFRLLCDPPADSCGKFVAMLGRNQRKMAVVLALVGGAIL